MGSFRDHKRTDRHPTIYMHMVNIKLTQLNPTSSKDIKQTRETHTKWEEKHLNANLAFPVTGFRFLSVPLPCHHKPHKTPMPVTKTL